MRQTTLTLALGVVFSSFAYAESLPEFVGETIVVTPTRTPLADVDAPFASEVHTRHMIEQSGATTLYDYLAQHTSLLVLPSYGNKASPKIDMRGFGIGDGYQNIVVSLDGRRLNNIDMSSQLLGAIPLGDIERIEITKGSGSVLFGDGATAGTIQIVTRQHSGASVQVSAGNFGAQNATLAAGLKKERFSISASADYAGFDGASERDVTGHRAASRNGTQQGKLEVNPLDGLTLSLDGSRSRIDTRYVGALTLAEYEANPAQNSGNTYTHQKFETDVWGVGLAYVLAPGWKLTARHQQEDKLSNYITYASKSDYDYRSDDLALEYRGDRLNVTAGVQAFDGTRMGSTNRTTKDNTGWFMQGQYLWGATTVSAGARTENVEYIYTPNAGAALKADHDLSAWDIGINHRLDKQLSLFANYNQAFQAPDIDRFFNWGGTFNAFISPAKSRTVNVGLNHVTAVNRLKLTLFHAKLDNEIYLNSLYTNTNLDKTHKYGLELQDTWQIAPTLAASINYAYTRALIDREDDGNGTYDGKDLPGVPRHGLNLGLNWRVTPASSLNLTHTWRATTWAAEDFDNNNAQKQQAYQSTNLAYQYRYKQVDWFAAVDNLFEQSNGIWIRDDAIYPVNFSRNWRVGMKVEF
ncbi:MAG: TonB-dependent receptor [Gammaproteobacteria bacterium]|nr:TonB-dependent receptor [Gammaproteobacteria bacterium]